MIIPRDSPAFTIHSPFNAVMKNIGTVLPRLAEIETNREYIKAVTISKGSSKAAYDVKKASTE